MEEYSVRFMPRENGVHKIHVKFNGVHIPGSPFSVKVGKDTADPAAVHAQGAGLNQVKTGMLLNIIYLNIILQIKPYIIICCEPIQTLKGSCKA